MGISKFKNHSTTSVLVISHMVEHLSERGEPFVSGGKLTIRKERPLYSPHFPKETSTKA